MNKKIFAIAMIMLFVASAFVLADSGAVFSGQGTTTLTVKPSVNNKGVSGQVCVTFEKTDGSRATVDINFEVPMNSSKTYSIPGKILFWSETYCYVLSE